MNTIPMICAAYVFLATGFCVGFVACAVLSRNATGEHARQEPQK